MGEVCMSRLAYCVVRAGNTDAFGRVLSVADGKGAKSVQKGTENSKLLARISAYLRVWGKNQGKTI